MIYCGWIILELGTVYFVSAFVQLSAIFGYICKKCFHASLHFLIGNKSWDEHEMHWASSGHHKVPGVLQSTTENIAGMLTSQGF